MSVGHRAEVNSEIAFKQHIYFPVLDCVISELESRFSSQASAIMFGIQALTPKHNSFLNESLVNGFAKIYNGEIEDLGHEIYQLKRLLSRMKQNSTFNLIAVLDLARFLRPYKMAFAELYKLLTVAMVLPVTSAACERSFLHLSRLKRTFEALCVTAV